MTKRKIIEIDEDRCDGCGQCVATCAEGALALVGGKARLVSDVYCDGLGACIGDCPAGALTVVVRDAPASDASEAGRRPGPGSSVGHEARHESGRVPSPALACGCPGTHEMTLETTGASRVPEISAGDRPSELSHWPIKLRLLNPAAPYLAGADLLLLADCAAAACPNLHGRLLKGRRVAMGCPKFDDVDFSIERLTDIINEARPASITVAHMEVPCCNGLFVIAERAVAQSHGEIPVSGVVISRTGEIARGEDRIGEDGRSVPARAV